MSGVLANLGFWFLAGIPAIVTGHVALRQARREPERYGGANLALAGLVLGYANLVLGAVIVSLLLARWQPATGSDLARAQEIRCINQLKELGLAARLYAAEHGGRYPPDLAAVEQVVGHPRALRCPSGVEPSADASYEYLTPNDLQTEIAHRTAFRCKIHGTVCMGDGRVTRAEGPAR